MSPSEVRGERPADKILYSLSYEELHSLASHVYKGAPEATLNTTGLVHEAYLKLRNHPEFASLPQAHFKSIVAKAMRRIAVDAARRKKAEKRGGPDASAFIPLDEVAAPMVSGVEDLLALDGALDELASVSPRQAAMIENRFFGGLSISETAEVLGVSEETIGRDWRAAKAWLGSRIRRNPHTNTKP